MQRWHSDHRRQKNRDILTARRCPATSACFPTSVFTSEWRVTLSAESSVPISAEPAAENSNWRKFANWLVRRRIRISVVVFLILIAEDVLERIRPHDLLNVHDVKSMLGIALVVTGLAIRSWAAGILHKRTTLTTTGPYALLRHPLYVGSLLMMVGICTLIDDSENIWIVLGPICLVYVIGVLHEERTLANLFGGQWSEYVQSTPRFFPRRMPKAAFADWTLQQWLANREYQALVAVILGLAAMEVWRRIRS